MANRYYGLNRGQVQKDVVEGSSTGSTDVELRVDLSKGLTQAEVLQIMEILNDFIVSESKWPPA